MSVVRVSRAVAGCVADPQGARARVQVWAEGLERWPGGAYEFEFSAKSGDRLTFGDYNVLKEPETRGSAASRPANTIWIA
jgi:hypothetical protein